MCLPSSNLDRVSTVAFADSCLELVLIDGEENRKREEDLISINR